MKSIWVIAANTFREVIRDRILYGIIVFALMLIGVSIALGGLSFAEQARISANFGFTGIQIGASILAIFVGSTLVSKEIDKQTILTLLARPISRTQFVFGKFLGLTLTSFTILIGLACVLAAVVSFLELEIGMPFVVALFGIFLEVLVLISLTLFFGSFSRPMMTVIFASCLFLIGHWVSSLDGLMKLNKNQDESFKTLVSIVTNIVPDLENFNWRSAPIYNDVIPMQTIASSTAYALGWSIVLLTATSLIFRRRDFV